MNFNVANECEHFVTDKVIIKSLENVRRPFDEQVACPLSFKITQLSLMLHV